MKSIRLTDFAGHIVFKDKMLTEDQRLVCEQTAQYAKPEPFIRVSGETTCEICKEPNFRHPRKWPFDWLHVACDGTLLKF